MGFYVFEFNIPANTLEASPVRLDKAVLAPYLTRMSIIIPNGHQGLARLRVESRERAIAPTLGSDPMWIRGDGNQIEMTPNYLMDGPDWILSFIGWNADTIDDHAFLIYINAENKGG